MRLIVPCFALLLAACQPLPPDPDVGQDSCGAAVWQARFGQPIASVPVPTPGARVIRPGDAVTEDFSPSRLNLDLDATGRVIRAWCG